MTWLVGIDLAEPPLQKAPVNRLRELHQRVLHVDDLIKQRAEQIAFTRLPPLLRSHCHPSTSTPSRQRIMASDSRESYATDEDRLAELGRPAKRVALRLALRSIDAG
jgi:hypothetical protein